MEHRTPRMDGHRMTTNELHLAQAVIFTAVCLIYSAMIFIDSIRYRRQNRKYKKWMETFLRDKGYSEQAIKKFLKK